MGKPVNLNRYRKTKARADKKARADQNAVLHGMPKATKTAAKSEQAIKQKKHDGIRITPTSQPENDTGADQ